MGCCIAIVGMMAPRILLILVFVLTHWFSVAYQTWVWPLLGFLFMPYTTLAYMAAMLKNNGSLSGGWVALFIVAVILDAGHWGSGGVLHRQRRK